MSDEVDTPVMSTRRFVVILVLGMASFFLFYAMATGPSATSCIDRYYDQGFRGDDLTAMAEACMDQ